VKRLNRCKEVATELRGRAAAFLAGSLGKLAVAAFDTTYKVCGIREFFLGMSCIGPGPGCHPRAGLNAGPADRICVPARRTWLRPGVCSL